MALLRTTLSVLFPQTRMRGSKIVGRQWCGESTLFTGLADRKKKYCSLIKRHLAYGSLQAKHLLQGEDETFITVLQATY
jgi:hypothetical protein